MDTFLHYFTAIVVLLALAYANGQAEPTYRGCIHASSLNRTVIKSFETAPIPISYPTFCAKFCRSAISQDETFVIAIHIPNDGQLKDRLVCGCPLASVFRINYHNDNYCHKKCGGESLVTCGSGDGFLSVYTMEPLELSNSTNASSTGHPVNLVDPGDEPADGVTYRGCIRSSSLSIMATVIGMLNMSDVTTRYPLLCKHYCDSKMGSVAYKVAMHIPAIGSLLDNLVCGCPETRIINTVEHFSNSRCSLLCQSKRQDTCGDGRGYLSVYDTLPSSTPLFTTPKTTTAAATITTPTPVSGTPFYKGCINYESLNEMLTIIGTVDTTGTAVRYPKLCQQYCDSHMSDSGYEIVMHIPKGGTFKGQLVCGCPTSSDMGSIFFVFDFLCSKKCGIGNDTCGDGSQFLSVYSSSTSNSVVKAFSSFMVLSLLLIHVII